LLFLIRPNQQAAKLRLLHQSPPSASLLLAASKPDAPSSSSSSNNYKVICLGELLIDFVATETNQDLSRVAGFTAAAGGAPANVAVGLSRLDFDSAFVGCVGKDPFGVKLRRTLEEAGVDTSFLIEAADKEDIRTTIGFVSVWDDGRKDLCFYRGADRYLQPESITEALFQNPNNEKEEQMGTATTKYCFHYGSITLIDKPGSEAQYKAIQMARDQGAMVTYDPNYRPTLWPDEATARRVIQDAFRYAHMVKISEEEFSFVTGRDKFQDGINAVLAMGVELVIVSRGEHGAIASNGKFTIEIPALSSDLIQVVETTGAGDAFMASMITKLLPEFHKHGGSLKDVKKDVVKEALEYANIVAGLACTKPGAIPALPTVQEVEDFLQSLRERSSSGNASSPSNKEKRSEDTIMRQYASMIDHTFLKPHLDAANNDDIEKLCQEAKEYGFAMVAINPCQVEACCRLLQDSNVRVGAAVGFPLGQTTSAAKAFEICDALERGADEIDMVLNIRELQRDNLDLVQKEIQSLADLCQEFSAKRKHKNPVISKVILETCYLTNEQKIQACNICRDVGVDFVKTSTGFGSAGATVEDVALMRNTVGPTMGVKASGGIRDLATFEAMVEAGANRIGTSNGVAIMKDLQQRLGSSSRHDNKQSIRPDLTPNSPSPPTSMSY
jgi:deoxyribose-phosphate aldolase